MAKPNSTALGLKSQPLHCRQCGGLLPRILTSGRPRLFCDLHCRSRWERNRVREKLAERETPLSPGTTGAMSELIAACDLMAAGLHVFRALSPACPSDLIVITRDGRAARVEVRTGRVREDGGIRCSFAPKDFGRADMLAVVFEASIHYCALTPNGAAALAAGNRENEIALAPPGVSRVAAH